MVENLREHWRKYGIVALAVALALTAVYQSGARAVHRLELYSESILNLSPGNVPQRTPVFGDGRLPASDGVASPRRPPYVPPEATVVITPKDPSKTLSEVINVSIHGQYGFTFEPGIDFALAPVGIGLDAKILYAKRFGLELGSQHFVAPFQSNSPTLGVSYRLDQFRLTKNSEIKLGYAPLAPFPAYLSLRVNF